MDLFCFFYQSLTYSYDNCNMIKSKKQKVPSFSGDNTD